MRREPVVDEHASEDATAGCFRAIGIAMITALATFLAVIAGIWMFVTWSPLGEFDYLPASEVAGRVATVILDDIGEDPHVGLAPRAEHYPIAAEVHPVYVGVLEDAFDLMRSTEAGAELFDLLVENDVPVSVEPIAYNAGYTRTRWAWHGWISSEIVINTDLVRSRNLDTLAAILVHEATHAARAINGESCFYSDSCETMANGVALEEEVAAHAAEAEFWRELFGSDGKRFAVGTDTGQNQLLEELQTGPAAFERYVRQIRSDDREGAGL